MPLTLVRVPRAELGRSAPELLLEELATATSVHNGQLIPNRRPIPTPTLGPCLEAGHGHAGAAVSPVPLAGRCRETRRDCHDRRDATRCTSVRAPAGPNPRIPRRANAGPGRLSDTRPGQPPKWLPRPMVVPVPPCGGATKEERHETLRNSDRDVGHRATTGGRLPDYSSTGWSTTRP